MTRYIIQGLLSILVLFQSSACTAALPGASAGELPASPPPAVQATAAPQPEQTAAAEEDTQMTRLQLTFNGHTYAATLAENSSAQAFVQLLQEQGGAMTVDMSDYGSFEKVGPLGTTLPRNDEQITTSAGDIILYLGSSITVYYDKNSWNFTRLGRLDDPEGLKEALGNGDVSITFQLTE